MVEVASGALFGFLAWHLGLGLQLGIVLVYVSLLITIFVIDLETWLVLNRLTYPGMALALALSFLWPFTASGEGPVGSLAGGAVGLGAMAAPYLLSRGGMGMGDVKLGVLVGLMTGYPLVFVAILGSFVAGGVVAIILLAFRMKGRKDALPFAPFLTTLALVTLLWGEQIWEWYTGWPALLLSS